MDAAFGSHSSQADMDELFRIQHEIGLVELLSRGDNVTMSDEKNEVRHVESSVV